MGSTPPAEPPRKPLDRHIVWAIVLTMAFIIASGIFMVVFGLRILTRSLHVKGGINPALQMVTVKTPTSDFKVSMVQNSSAVQLGLPIYPGATRVKDSQKDYSVSLTFDLSNSPNLRVAFAKFNTPDPIAKVREFYKQQLAGKAVTAAETDRNGNPVFEIKYGEQDKVVSLKPHVGGTQIALARIFHRGAEPN